MKRIFFYTLSLLSILTSLFLFKYSYDKYVLVAKNMDIAENIPVTVLKDISEQEKIFEEKLTDFLPDDDLTPLPVEIDKDTRGLVVGQIIIPSIGMNLSIFKGETSYLGDNMLYGAVTNKIKQEMGKRNYVLSSHLVDNKKELFSNIDELKENDLIYLSDSKYLYTYKTTKSFVVKPKDTWILEDISGKATLTLYTCIYIDEYIDGEQLTDREVVQADYIGKTEITDTIKKEYSLK